MVCFCSDPSAGREPVFFQADLAFDSPIHPCRHFTAIQTEDRCPHHSFDRLGPLTSQLSLSSQNAKSIMLRAAAKAAARAQLASKGSYESRQLLAGVLGPALSACRGFAAAAAGGSTDVIVVGGGVSRGCVVCLSSPVCFTNCSPCLQHNGLVAATLLAQQGLRVEVFEERDMVGGACRTEYPFTKAPGLPQSTGAS
jgi:hypothetical protein